MRGGILAFTTGDALVPVFSMLARAVASRFNTEPSRIKAGLEVREGKLMPSFGVPADALAEVGVSEDEAREIMRQAWAMARPLVRRSLLNARGRWHELG